MAEYGAFNDAGCFLAGFGTLSAAAEEAAYGVEAGDEWAYAAEICPEHDEEALDTCEECFAEDEDEDDEDSDDD